MLVTVIRLTFKNLTDVICLTLHTSKLLIKMRQLYLFCTKTYKLFCKVFLEITKIDEGKVSHCFTE